MSAHPTRSTSSTAATRRCCFRDIFRRGKGKKWSFGQSPLFLDFLAGNQTYHCTPWGNPTRNVFGWQRPCYLLGEGYAKTYRELMDETDWDKYGTGNYEKCADCMVHSGFEATARDGCREASAEGFGRHAARTAHRRADGRGNRPYQPTQGRIRLRGHSSTKDASVSKPRSGQAGAPRRLDCAAPAAFHPPVSSIPADRPAAPTRRAPPRTDSSAPIP